MSPRKISRPLVTVSAAVAICLLGTRPAAPADAPPPRWPLDLPTRYLTSDFMEHRDGRFHAGLDLRTDATPGHPVHAVEDGWLDRIRLSTAGYGRALYLRGESGRIYVYAHLERLADPWRALVAEAQRRRDRYDVALQFPAGRYPVKRGDVLALSGQSGTAGPHLHFEVRDAANRPLDPQAWGFAVVDSIPPRILAVRCLPAGPDARVGGGAVACVLDGGGALDGELPPLTVRGPVAFTARVVEHVDRMGYRLEPWRLETSLDDSLVFAAENDAFDFDRQGEMRLEWLTTPLGRERWLMRRDGDDLPGRLGSEWSRDPAVLTPGGHRVRIRAIDRSGNVAQVAWNLNVLPAGGTAAPSDGWTASPVRVEAGGGAWLTPFLTVAADGTAAAVPRGDAVALPDSLTPSERARALRDQGLAARDWSLRVDCADWTRAAPLEIPVDAALPDTLPAAAGVYLQRDDGDWSPAGRLRRAGGRWWLDATAAGRYALFDDRTPPYLGPGPEEGIVGPGPAAVDPAVTPPRWEKVALRLEDRGSGVDVSAIAVALDGAPLIAEPDPPRARLLVELPDDLAPGVHTLEVTAADVAGGAVGRRYRLVLTP